MLWIALHFPKLPLEVWQPRTAACRHEPAALANAHALIGVNAAAFEAGLRAGLSCTSALALEPRLKLFEEDPARVARALREISLWALGFTPRVALQGQAVLMEIEASLRLFRGLQALRKRLRGEVQAFDYSCTEALAPTAQGAYLLAVRAAERAPVTVATLPAPTLPALHAALDRLPVSSLASAARHLDTLARIGCHTLKDLRTLPRGGVVRRFGDAVLDELDRAYGLKTESHRWVEAPEVFHARIELPSRVESAEALLFAARRLLLQLTGWLTARHAAIRAFTLHWRHDQARRGVGPTGELEVRTAEPTRELDHLLRLLSEHLARTTLEAPVLELELHAQDAVPLPADNRSLLAEEQARDRGQGRENLTQLLERLAVRLGSERVMRPALCADHRPHRAQRWMPAQACAPSPAVRTGSAQTKKTKLAPTPFDAAPPSTALSRPPWILHRPLLLATSGNKPVFQGPLELLAGPERLEAGWWDNSPAEAFISRDYFIARSEQAGLLWIYRERLGDSTRGPAWYLHGIYG